MSSLREEYPVLYDWVYRACIDYEGLLVLFLAHAMAGEPPTSAFTLRHAREYTMAYLRHVAAHKIKFTLASSTYHRYFVSSLLASHPASSKLVQEWVEFEFRPSVKHPILTVLEPLPALEGCEGEEEVEEEGKAPRGRLSLGAKLPSSSSSPGFAMCCATFSARDVICAAVSPTHVVAAFESSPSPRVYKGGDKDVTYGSASWELKGHTQPVFDMDFCSEYQNLLTASGDGTVRYWVGGGGEVGGFTPPFALKSSYKIKFPCWAVAAHRSGSSFAVGGEYRDFPLIDMERASPAPSSSANVRTFSGHEHDVDLLEWHPHGGGYLMSASSDQTLRLWDVSSTKSVRTFHGRASMTAMAISPDGKLVSAATCLGTWMTWDIGTQAVVARGRVPGDTPIYAISYAPSGTLLLSYGGNIMGVGGEGESIWSIRRDKIVHLQSFETLTMVIAV